MTLTESFVMLKFIKETSMNIINAKHTEHSDHVILYFEDGSQGLHVTSQRGFYSNAYDKYVSDGGTVLPYLAVPAEILRVAEIDARLAENERECIRPLRAIAVGSATEFDTQKLAELNTEAEALRVERATLAIE